MFILLDESYILLFAFNRQFKTFFGDDIWLSLTEQARFDGKIPQMITINEIASSWIAKDRIPVVTVLRNYEDNSVTFIQASDIIQNMFQIEFTIAVGFVFI